MTVLVPAQILATIELITLIIADMLLVSESQPLNQSFCTAMMDMFTCKLNPMDTEWQPGRPQERAMGQHAYSHHIEILVLRCEL